MLTFEWKLMKIKNVFYIILYIKMKKKLLTLWVAWLLAWSPSVHAESDTIKTGTKKDLVEAVITSEQNKLKNSTTISFEEGNRLLENKELIEKVLKDEEVQAVIETYWQENIEKITNEVIKSQDTEEIVKKAMENKEIQKALKEWNKEKFEELIREIIKDHNEYPIWALVLNAVVCIAVRESLNHIWRKLRKK